MPELLHSLGWAVFVVAALPLTIGFAVRARLVFGRVPATAAGTGATP